MLGRRIRTKGHSFNEWLLYHASSGSGKQTPHVLRGKCALAYEILIALLVQVLASFIRSRRADCYGRCCCCSRSCRAQLRSSRSSRREISRERQYCDSRSDTRGVAPCCRSQNGIFVPLSASVAAPRHGDRFSRITLVSHRRCSGIMSEYILTKRPPSRPFAVDLLFLYPRRRIRRRSTLHVETKSTPRKKRIRSELRRASRFFLINRQP